MMHLFEYSSTGFARYYSFSCKRCNNFVNLTENIDDRIDYRGMVYEPRTEIEQQQAIEFRDKPFDSKELKCSDDNKKTIKRIYRFVDKTYVWLLCDECKFRPAFQNWDKEEKM
ncbi:hypothetical protein OAJ86_01825 [Nitrosopumilus sp.]|nr:hypothetical protein [Nitrosopumilus sp.]